MKNTNMYEIMRLSEHLRAMVCSDGEIISVNYAKMFGPRLSIQVRSPKTVDEIATTVKMRRNFDYIRYYVESDNIEVFTLITRDKAMKHTGKSFEEIEEILDGRKE